MPAKFKSAKGAAKSDAPTTTEAKPKATKAKAAPKKAAKAKAKAKPKKAAKAKAKPKKAAKKKAANPKAAAKKAAATRKNVTPLESVSWPEIIEKFKKGKAKTGSTEMGSPGSAQVTRVRLVKAHPKLHFRTEGTWIHYSKVKFK